MIFNEKGKSVQQLPQKLRNKISRAILTEGLTSAERAEFLRQSRHRFVALRENHIEEETVNDMVDDAATEVGVEMGNTDPNQEPIVDVDLVDDTVLVAVAKENQDILAKKYAVVLQMKKELERQMEEKYGKEAESTITQVSDDMVASESSLVSLAATRYREAKKSKKR